MTPPDAHTDHPSARLRLLALDVPDAGPLSVLVLADDPLARAGLASFFADTDGYVVVGSTALDDDLEGAVRAFQPDVALWDLGTREAVLSDLQPLLDAAVPLVALVPDAGRVEDAWTAGARALLVRTAEPGQILTALFAVHRGLLVIDPDLVEEIFEMRQHMPDLADLTPREQEVLTLLAEGLPNKLIADRLGISVHTVKFHVAALLGKLGAQSRTEAVVLAARQGFLVV